MDKYKQPNQYRKKVVDGTSPKNDKLLRNDFIKELGHPYFTDVTKEAGILIEGFGLGVCVSDLNQDGWKDICLLYTSPSPRDGLLSRMPSSA